MHEFDTIFLSWRTGQGSRRYIVGKLIRVKNQKEVYEFHYFPEEVDKALEYGFSPYTEFPDVNKIYNGNVLEVFAQRLTKSERPDIQKFYDFWEIKPELVNDKFYLLGHTQGLSPTDNFEFLADYNPIDGLSFITELASLSKQNLPADAINLGDELSFELEKDNLYDSEAVKVFKENRFLGYIKKIHCRIFHKARSENLKLIVKAIERNGVIKRVFIKVTRP